MQLSNDGQFFIKNSADLNAVALDTAVAVTCRGQFLVQNCVNISEGGMLLRVFSRYLMGDLIEVGCFIPDGQFVKAVAEVAVHYGARVRLANSLLACDSSKSHKRTQLAIRDNIEGKKTLNLFPAQLNPSCILCETWLRGGGGFWFVVGWGWVGVAV